MESTEDLKRDVLKSDSAAMQIPELELELQHGTLGGYTKMTLFFIVHTLFLYSVYALLTSRVYTTVEGLLLKITSNLRDNNPFCFGDSSVLHHSSDESMTDSKSRFDEFIARLDAVASGKIFPFTLVIRDPLGNSFISARLGSFVPPEVSYF